MNKQEYIKGLLALNPDLSSHELADKVGCSKRTVRRIKASLKPKPKDSVVGIIADTHIPACHPDYLRFCIDTFKAHGVTTVVHIGDVIDHHAISRHVSEPNADTAISELGKAVKELKKWVKAFPNVKWCAGNHDQIPFRQAKELGIPKHFIKSLNDLYELPETWEIADHHEIDGVWYEHGLGSNGMYGMKNTAMKLRCSYVQGHTHANAGVLYITGANDTIFGMNVGCGADNEHTAMTYGENYKSKPTIGCGIVKNGKEALFIPIT